MISAHILEKRTHAEKKAKTRRFGKSIILSYYPGVALYNKTITAFKLQ